MRPASCVMCATPSHKRGPTATGFSPPGYPFAHPIAALSGRSASIASARSAALRYACPSHRVHRESQKELPKPPQHLFRPCPDEELTRRVVTVRAYELPERTLDLGPGLLLFGVAEPDHELAQGKRSPRVLHGLGEGWEAPPSGNRVDGYLPEACRSV